MGYNQSGLTVEAGGEGAGRSVVMLWWWVLFVARLSLGECSDSVRN